MKPKRKRATKKPRKTLNKRILEALKVDPILALEMAHAGPDFDANVEYYRNRAGGLTPAENWIFDAQYSQSAACIPEALTAAIHRAVIQGDGNYFRKLAAQVEAMNALNRAHRGPRKGAGAVWHLLVSAVVRGEVVNLSELARECAVDVRLVWKLNKEIGAKTMNPGRPGK